MSTTSLFAEILIIGAGAALAACVWIWTILGGGPLPSLGEDAGAVGLAALPFVYFLGVLVDRWGDVLFTPVDALLGRRVYRAASVAAFHAVYFPDHRLVREESGPLSAVLDYAKSRIRICRGWVVNSALLAAGVGTALAQGLFPEGPTGALALGGTVGVGLASLVVVLLDRREYVAKVKRQAAWIRQRVS
ncbi:MAG: hypothetical protein KTR31_40155 [Myxococcales bacterium]|nr:hypothetical protein [Myxococcales bacterium]